MANRYWVGTGNGLWSSTTNWSATSGGASGASVPAATDAVIFDSNSGSGSSYIDVNFNPTSTIAFLTTTGFTGRLYTKAPAGTGTAFIVKGNVTLGNTAYYSPEGTMYMSPVGAATLTATNLQIPFFVIMQAPTGTTSSRINLASNVYFQKPLAITSLTVGLSTFNLSAPTISLTGNNPYFVGIDFGNSGSSYINIYGDSSVVFTTSVLNYVNTYVGGTQKPLIKLSYAGTYGTRNIAVAPSSNTIPPKFSYEIYGGDTISWNGSTGTFGSSCIDFDGTNFNGKYNALPQYISGNFTVNNTASTLAQSGIAQIVNFATTNSKTIVCNNPNMFVAYVINGGTCTLGSNFQAVGGITYTSGNIDLNGYTIKTNLFSATTAGGRNINLNNGTIEIFATTGTSTFQVNASGLTYSGTGNLKATCANTTGIININPNNMFMPVNLILNSLGRTSINGSNTFLSLSNTEVGSIYFQAGAKTIFLSGFSLYGNPTQQYVVGCTSAALNYLGMPSGNANCDYLQLAWSSAAYGNAPDPLNYNSVWYAGPSSTVLSGSTVVNWFPKSAGQFLEFFP